MSLHDFYLYLKYVEHSSENLEFYLWSVPMAHKAIAGRVVADNLGRYLNYKANYPKSKGEPVAAAAVPVKELPSLPSEADAMSETTYSAMSSNAEIVAGKFPSRASQQIGHVTLGS